MSHNESRNESPFPKEGVTDCLKAIQDYRGQQISKWEAVLQIANAIKSVTTSMDGGQWASAGGTYLTMLNEHDKLLV